MKKIKCDGCVVGAGPGGSMVLKNVHEVFRLDIVIGGGVYIMRK